MTLVLSANKNYYLLLWASHLRKRERVLVQELIPGAHHVQPSPIQKEY
jgi:hypothetical protein